MVGLLVATEVAVAAVEIGVDGHAVADTHVGYVAAHLDHHAAKLVAGDQGKVRHVFVAVDVDVGAANAAARDLDHDLVAGAGGVGHAFDGDRFSLGEDDCLHRVLLYQAQ